MGTTIKIGATIEIEFDSKAPRKLNIVELSEAISSAVSGCSQIENVASVSVPLVEVQHQRCDAKNAETGQCELKQDHPGKHLAGYLMWSAPPAER